MENSSTWSYTWCVCFSLYSFTWLCVELITHSTHPPTVCILTQLTHHHLVTHSPSRPPTHSPTHSPTYSLYSPTWSLTHSLTHSPSLLTHSPTHSLTHSLTHLLTHSQALTHSLTHTHTHSSTHTLNSLTIITTFSLSQFFPLNQSDLPAMSTIDQLCPNCYAVRDPSTNLSIPTDPVEAY